MQEMTKPPMPEIPLDPNAQMAIEQKEGKDARDDATKKEMGQLRLVELDKKLSADKEADFAKFSAEERQQAVEAAEERVQQATEYVARLKELQLKEAGDSERTAATLEMKHTVNKEDNLTALAIAEAEIESGERVSVSTGTGLDPSG